MLQECLYYVCLCRSMAVIDWLRRLFLHSTLCEKGKVFVPVLAVSLCLFDVDILEHIADADRIKLYLGHRVV